MRPLFVWLTPLDIKGQPEPKEAFAVAYIVNVAPGRDHEYQEWPSDEPGPTHYPFKAGAEVSYLIAGESGIWTRSVLEEPEGVVLLCEGRATLQFGKPVPA